MHACFSKTCTGLPRISRIKLPSRNWLIFLSIVGSWTTLLVYDRYHKRRIQRKWSNFVAHLSEEEIAARQLQRRITILLAAPPGDSLRVSREHFHEYVKPILVAGALDWEVIEGRREGEVRAGLAEKIRKLRERNGEARRHEEDDGVSPEEAVRVVRHGMKINDWPGVNGDLVIGRHTWKEYIRGLHEGWLGPIDAPTQAEPKEAEAAHDDPDFPDAQKSKGEDEQKEKPAEKPSGKPPPTPPYISPIDYPSASPSPNLPSSFPPSTAVPLPHILGIRNTPIRMYRFLNRRRLADEAGASIAALVLASRSRPFAYDKTAISSTSLSDDSFSSDDTSPSNPSNVDSSFYTARPAVTPSTTWEQDILLKEAEPDWHKSARKPNPEGDTRERVWKEAMVIDPRIGTRMQAFELPEGAREKADEMEKKARREAQPIWKQVQQWAGFGRSEKRGWDMGLEGNEDS